MLKRQMITPPEERIFISLLRQEVKIKAGAGIPTIQAVIPLPEDSCLDITNNPTNQSTSAESIHAPQTPGEDVNCIRFSILAKFKIQFYMRWR